MPRRPIVDAIEFLKGRVYLGAYDRTPKDTEELVYFTVEDSLPYNPFHLDFGPLHIGHLYRFAVTLHEVLNDPANKGKAVVFYSSTGAKERSNAACLLCCYMVVVQSWSPHQVLHPIAQHEPPFMPFRDAGYSHADFELTIQDVVYGVWRAKERGMIDLNEFKLEEYERYERVDQGDFNVISKDFIAFASPKQPKPGAPLNEPFRSVLSYFGNNDVQLVVRLNSHLYDAAEFVKRGIQHVDMIFEDGTCPTMDYVKKFVGAAETVISNGGKIAVHCKAGLGRTGCLIGAHLIYTHGFTANECIAYMRMIRPGMVVGPQQHWLYLHQHEFRDWRHTMVIDNIPDDSIGGLYPLVPYDEYRARKKKLFDHENDSLLVTPVRRRKISGQIKAAASKAVPMESPGQPRKFSPERNYVSGGEEEYTMESVKENIEDPKRLLGSPRRVVSSAQDPADNTQWKVLRSVTGPNSPGNIQVTKTKTTTTTMTTTVSSPPPSYEGNTLSMPKTRKRVVSATGKLVGNPGIRKISQSAKRVQ
ncbi:unnamed protein product [Kuraishia capsulata CBS 1993]|uniref:Tyrosine-protein phosphatase CDC14 n=1 Tax=Kuraishia capsulata CBS 1993 TaxID=1382522 RepID=W6MQD0_9ASCO|nr:uncharacterized protein KUCA_T00004486001 [Kuraishia capsulata CBS 1993]CDK28503.1 unnamed protein product [Kuraishia capsulata CBS 1993]